MAAMDSASRLQRDMVKLVDTPAPRVVALTAPKPRAAIPATRGSATIAAPVVPAGIAAPLTEVQDTGGVATSRTYHPATYLASANGMITIKRLPVASIEFMDAVDRLVPFVLAKPPV